MTQKKNPRVFPSASRKESRRSANRYVKLVFRTLGTKEREKEIYVFGRPKELQHFSGPHFYIFMGPAMIAGKFTIFDQRSSKKSLHLLRREGCSSRSVFSKSVMHFRAIMCLNNGCAARQELPWVDSPRQASTGPARTVLSPRLKVAGEKFLRSPDRPHTLFFSEKMASTRIFSPKCLKILTSFKFLFFMCKTTDILFGHF